LSHTSRENVARVNR